MEERQLDFVQFTAALNPFTGGNNSNSDRSNASQEKVSDRNSYNLHSGPPPYNSTSGNSNLWGELSRAALQYNNYQPFPSAGWPPSNAQGSGDVSCFAYGNYGDGGNSRNECRRVPSKGETKVTPPLPPGIAHDMASLQQLVGARNDAGSMYRTLLAQQYLSSVAAFSGLPSSMTPLPSTQLHAARHQQSQNQQYRQSHYHGQSSGGSNINGEVLQKHSTLSQLSPLLSPLPSPQEKLTPPELWWDPKISPTGSMVKEVINSAYNPNLENSGLISVSHSVPGNYKELAKHSEDNSEGLLSKVKERESCDVLPSHDIDKLENKADNVEENSIASAEGPRSESESEGDQRSRHRRKQEQPRRQSVIYSSNIHGQEKVASTAIESSSEDSEGFDAVLPRTSTTNSDLIQDAVHGHDSHVELSPVAHQPMSQAMSHALAHPFLAGHFHSQLETHHRGKESQYYSKTQNVMDSIPDMCVVTTSSGKLTSGHSLMSSGLDVCSHENEGVSLASNGSNCEFIVNKPITKHKTDSVNENATGEERLNFIGNKVGTRSPLLHLKAEEIKVTSENSDKDPNLICQEHDSFNVNEKPYNGYPAEIQPVKKRRGPAFMDLNSTSLDREYQHLSGSPFDSSVNTDDDAIACSDNITDKSESSHTLLDLSKDSSDKAVYVSELHSKNGNSDSNNFYETSEKVIEEEKPETSHSDKILDDTETGDMKRRTRQKRAVSYVEDATDPVLEMSDDYIPYGSPHKKRYKKAFSSGDSITSELGKDNLSDPLDFDAGGVEGENQVFPGNPEITSPNRHKSGRGRPRGRGRGSSSPRSIVNATHVSIECSSKISSSEHSNVCAQNNTILSNVSVDNEDLYSLKSAQPLKRRSSPRNSPKKCLPQSPDHTQSHAYEQKTEPSHSGAVGTISVVDLCKLLENPAEALSPKRSSPKVVDGVNLNTDNQSTKDNEEFQAVSPRRSSRLSHGGNKSQTQSLVSENSTHYDKTKLDNVSYDSSASSNLNTSKFSNLFNKSGKNLKISLPVVSLNDISSEWNLNTSDSQNNTIVDHVSTKAAKKSLVQIDTEKAKSVNSIPVVKESSFCFSSNDGKSSEKVPNLESSFSGNLQTSEKCYIIPLNLKKSNLSNEDESSESNASIDSVSILPKGTRRMIERQLSSDSREALEAEVAVSVQKAQEEEESLSAFLSSDDRDNSGKANEADCETVEDIAKFLEETASRTVSIDSKDEKDYSQKNATVSQSEGDVNDLLLLLNSDESEDGNYIKKSASGKRDDAYIDICESDKMSLKQKKNKKIYSIKQKSKKDASKKRKSAGQPTAKPSKKGKEQVKTKIGDYIYGPYIRINKHSCVDDVVNAPSKDDEEPSRRIGSSVFYCPHEGKEKSFKISGVYNSTLHPNYDAFTKDPSWICAFCKNFSHYLGIGDLFGPFFIEGLSVKKKKIPKIIDGQVVEGIQSPRIDAHSSRLRGRRILRHDGSGESPDLKKHEVDCGGTSPPWRFVPTATPARMLGRISQQAAGNSKVMSFNSEKASSSTAGISEENSNMTCPKGTEFWLHEACVLWASGVYLRNSRLCGLEEAVILSQEKVCDECGETGATVSCLGKGCSQIVHVPCAMLKSWTLDKLTFKSLCPKHPSRVGT